MVYGTPEEARAACKKFHKRTLADLVARHAHTPTAPDQIYFDMGEKVDKTYDHLIELDPTRMRDMSLELYDIVDERVRRTSNRMEHPSTQAKRRTSSHPAHIQRETRSRTHFTVYQHAGTRRGENHYRRRARRM